MRLIDRLIIKDLIGPFFNGLLMFMLLVFTAGFLFKATDMLVQGAPVLLVLKFVLYALPSIVTQTFPMAMLLAALMGFGRLSSDREVIAIFAAGISFPRAARAVVWMGLAVSLIAFGWNETVVPPATRAMWDLQKEAVEKLSRSDQPLKYDIERDDGKGVQETVTVNGGYDATTQTARRVGLIKYSNDPQRKGQPEIVIYCARAHFVDQKGLDCTYYEGYVTTFARDDKTGYTDAQTLNFDELKTSKSVPTLGKNFQDLMKSDVNDANRMSFRALQAEIQQDQAQGRWEAARGKEVDLYGKLALPLASLIFGVVGAALGLNTQRGGGKTVGFGMAIFIVFLYWVFYHSMFVVGKNGGLPPIVASFLADIVGAIVGLFLAARASR